MINQQKNLLFAAILILLCLSSCVSSQAVTEGEESRFPNIPSPIRSELTSEAIFSIVPEETTARFELEEDLRSALTGWALGARITVVGETNQLAGDIVFDSKDLSKTAVSEIRIDAHSIKTDEFFRTRAIQNQILHTETYPTITFQPSDIIGLPSTVQLGERINFEIEGELTIREVTLTERFNITAMLVDENKLIGNAFALVSREAYGLTIPSVANVTFVEDPVELYIDFVARAQQ